MESQVTVFVILNSTSVRSLLHLFLRITRIFSLFFHRLSFRLLVPSASRMVIFFQWDDKRMRAAVLPLITVTLKFMEP